MLIRTKKNIELNAYDVISNNEEENLRRNKTTNKKYSEFNDLELLKQTLVDKDDLKPVDYHGLNYLDEFKF